MDLTQFRCFLALCHEMNFSRAAERMNMTQPPFSRQIKLLEDELGLQLFERTTRQVSLSAAGDLLRPRIESAVQAAAAVTATAQQVQVGRAGRLRLTFTSGAAYALLPKLIDRVHRELPDLELQLEERGTLDQLRSLDASEMDLAIVRPPHSLNGLKVLGTYHEGLRVTLPSGHPLARLGAPVALGQLMDETFLMFPPDTNEYLHGLTTGMLSRAGVIPKRVHYVRSAHSMMPLVALGLGVAIVPEGASQLRVQGVTMLPAAHETGLTADLHFLYHPASSNRALASVFDLVRNLGQESHPDAAAP